jgi:hypothetical protein
MLRRDKAELTSRLQEAEAEKEQLQKQIRFLSGVRPEVKFERLYRLQSIKITRYTNFYDKDKDGKKEKLIVYVKPIDKDGDVIKAMGEMDVQLWDLNREGSEALLGEWHVGAQELKKEWFATLLTINYRLTFEVAGVVERFDEPMTVRVTFTDYLTGRMFKDQKVIEP